MTGPRNAMLIERRADARVLEGQIRAHKEDCQDCGTWSVGRSCGKLQAMRNELKAVREELRTWFAPGPDDPSLFDDMEPAS